LSKFSLSTPFKSWRTPERLRGTAYFHDGAVGLLDADEYEVRTSVQGTQRYRVRLAAGSDGELEYECDCPVGDDGIFCKHAVAVALSWLENAGEEVFEPSEKEFSKPQKKQTHDEQIREYLGTLDESALRGWLIEAADRDRGIRDKLLFSAKAMARGDVASLKSVVGQATRVSGFVDWREAGDYADRLADLAQMLEARVADGDPKLVEIVEQAIAQAEDALGNIDDSNGSVMPAIMELREVHERACNNLNPDPVALAERLFRFQTAGDWDTFRSVLPSYVRALRQSGLERYRELVEAAWKRFPALGPESSHTHFDSDRYRVESHPGRSDPLVRCPWFVGKTSLRPWPDRRKPTQSGSSHCQKADSQTKLAAEVTLERPSIVLRSCCHESRPSRCRRRPAREAQGQGCTPGSG
jgi:hypothetical protein